MNLLEKVKANIVNRGVKFSTVADKWLSQKENSIKQSTYANYKYLITRYLMPELQEISLKQLENYDFNEFIRSKVEKLSSKTIAI